MSSPCSCWCFSWSPGSHREETSCMPSSRNSWCKLSNLSTYLKFGHRCARSSLTWGIFETLSRPSHPAIKSVSERNGRFSTTIMLSTSLNWSSFKLVASCPSCRGRALSLGQRTSTNISKRGSSCILGGGASPFWFAAAPSLPAAAAVASSSSSTTKYDGDDRRDGSSWRPQQQQQSQGYGRQQQEGERINDGGWQTVGEKKNHGRPQQSEAWNGYRKPPSEQQYSEDVDHQGVNVEPSREELNSLSKACSRLWELDMNRLVPGKDYRIDCGEGKKVYQKGDMASESLFSWLGDDVLRKPTYSRFCALLDNYNPHQGYKEVVTQQDKHEEVAFIEEIARTAPIKYLHRYLVQKGEVSQDYEDFKRMLASLWFDLYGRGGNSNCSSAFEHVICISGL
ncbi:hypothetical protein PAHAL_8G239800 [Panicum hallii]|uniref:EndoU domain-containing protein n=1 Tax=Panicum hallii TaxID=206008 RepID=A0A2S3IFC3_9POAL|nr:hypothetical protein PAHAL_8G239800 [Panicum hallii]